MRILNLFYQTIYTNNNIISYSYMIGQWFHSEGRFRYSGGFWVKHLFLTLCQARPQPSQPSSTETS